MALLHEILAVEKTTEAVANKLIEESKKTLKKDSLFSGQTRSLRMFNEEFKHLDTDEHQVLETTVLENIDYIIPYISKFWDVTLAKDKGNQLASESIKITDTLELKDIPVSFLLGLKSKLIKFRTVIVNIPTLPPGVDWIPDDQERIGVYKSKNDMIQFKSEKISNFEVVVESDEHHPAQVQKVVTVKNTGRYTLKKQSGMMTPVDKAKILSRLDDVLQAVKKARMRANCTKITHEKQTQNILNYIVHG